MNWPIFSKILRLLGVGFGLHGRFVLGFQRSFSQSNWGGNDMDVTFGGSTADDNPDYLNKFGNENFGGDTNFGSTVAAGEPIGDVEFTFGVSGGISAFVQECQESLPSRQSRATASASCHRS
jgi:hypothetical protein